MKAHPSLQPADVLRHGPAKIALMIASEFSRASSSGEYPSDVRACYERARELMGLLETIPLPVDIGRRLQAIYKRCRMSRLLAESKLSRTRARRADLELADEFQSAGIALRRHV